MIKNKKTWNIGRILNIFNCYAYNHGQKRKFYADMLKDYGVEIVNEKEYV